MFRLHQTLAAGLALLREHTFAVVFTDHQVPELTGLESLAQVKQLQPGAARVLISAVLNLTTVINAINRAEAFRFLIKPWQREDLLETVQAAVTRSEVGQRDRISLAAAQSSVESLTSRLNALKDELAPTAKLKSTTSGRWQCFT